MSNTKLAILGISAIALAGLGWYLNSQVPRETVIVGAEDDCREFYGVYKLEVVTRVDALRVACLYW